MCAKYLYVAMQYAGAAALVPAALIIFTSAVLLMLGTLAVIAMLDRPWRGLYGLAFVVSVVAVNVHFGFTIYLSRIALGLIVIVVFTRLMAGARGGVTFAIDGSLIALLAAMLSVQALSLTRAISVGAGVRQIFIYMSMMAIFVAVLVLGVSADVVIRSLRVYLAFAIIQGALGIYQVVGGFLRWPMYQDLLVNVPLGNPRNYLREFWYGNVMPRAFGFLSDVSHFGAYLVGVLLIATAFIMYSRRDWFSYLVLAVCIPALILSLSRSAMLTFAVIGLPALVLFARGGGFRLSTIALRTTKVILLLATIAGTVGVVRDYRSGGPGSALRLGEVLSGRLRDIVQPTDFDSTKVHLKTKRMALEAWQSNPVIGIGIGNAAEWTSPTFGEVWGGSHSHHLDVLGQTGSLGLLVEWSFMALVAGKIWLGYWWAPRRSREKMVLAALLAAFAAIFIGNFLYHFYLNDFVWFLMGSGVALSRAVVSQRARPPVSLPFAEHGMADAV